MSSAPYHLSGHYEPSLMLHGEVVCVLAAYSVAGRGPQHRHNGDIYRFIVALLNDAHRRGLQSVADMNRLIAEDEEHQRKERG